MASAILVIGASGQIGSELTQALRKTMGNDKVIAADIKIKRKEAIGSGPFELLDVTNLQALTACIKKYKIKTVYLMAAMLSATAEKKPQAAWNLNTASLFNVLGLAREKIINKIFWPSSIAVFGESTAQNNTPQVAVTEPTTVYGITKLVGERWSDYYFRHYGTDIRSIRYPGLISWKTPPGGGTTDYAVSIYYDALENQTYKCFLNKDTRLPMMYIDDAIRATMEIMMAPAHKISIRSSYNLAAMNFTPEEISASIKKHIPEFEISYAPDFRQEIANSWPYSINDSSARKDWQWKPVYDLDATTTEMLTRLKKLKALRNQNYEF